MEIKADFEIINRARSGDKTAFSQLVKLYQKNVYGLAWNITGNHEEADDLAQDTFVKVYNSIEKFRMESEFKTWIYRIMVNTHIDKKRKKTMPVLSQISTKNEKNQPAVMEIEDPVTANNPEKYTEATMINKHIEKALRVLSAKEKQAFVLKHYQGLSIREIAGIVHTSEGTIKSMLFRSVQKMQKALAFLKAEPGMGN